MNGYAFIATIIQAVASLAWPAVFALAVWLFRERLENLLPLLHVKHKDWEASFRLDQAEKDAAALPPAPESPDTTPTPEERDRFVEILNVSPRLAVVEIRRELEEALRDIIIKQGLPADHSKSLLGMTRLLRSQGIIDQHASAILDDLRVVGNQAVHSGDNISRDDAQRYRQLANDLLRHLVTASTNA